MALSDMGATAAASRAVGVLQRNPVIFLGALLVSLLSLPSYAVQLTGQPILSVGWSGIAFFLTPFLTGGLLGMADEGLEGATSLGTFFEAGRSNYVSLLVVALLLTVIVGGIAIVGGIILAMIGVFAIGFSSAGGVDPGLGGLAVIGFLVLLYLLVIMGLAFVFQFSNQAVVVDDVGAVDALRQSYVTVRGHILGALGVGAIAFVLSLVLTGPVVLTTIAMQPRSAFAFPFSESVAYAVLFGWGTVSSIIVGAFNNTMLVAFYDANAPTPAA